MENREISLVVGGICCLMVAASSAVMASMPAQAQFTAPRQQVIAPRPAPPPVVVETRPAPMTRADREREMVISTARQVISTVSMLPRQASVPASVQQQITAYAPNQAFYSSYGSANSYTSAHCEHHIRQAEVRHGLPPSILYAIALTESGRGGRPQPHAMNIQGRSHFANNNAEMEAIVNQYGTNASIDVGCMQVNLKYHANRFSDWRALLDPQTNADYAARYLLELRRELGSWSRAVGAYHSRTPWRGQNYACLVSRRYGQIYGSNRSGCGPDIESMVRLLSTTTWSR